MNFLVFGDKLLPCEANFAAIRTTEDNQEEWPAAAAVVRRDIFVDDLYTSCESEVEAVTLREEVTALMAKGGFPMRKWISTSPDVLATGRKQNELFLIRTWSRKSYRVAEL